MIDVAPLVSLGLLLVRPGTLILAAPGFGGAFLPAQMKVALTALLAIALMPLVGVPQIDSATGVAVVVGREMAIGLSLALALRALTAAAELGGHLVGFQMGLSYSAIVDPGSGVRNNAVAILYLNIAIVVFFLTNAHHAVLRALGDSYRMLPIGTGHVGQSVAQGVVALLGLVFAFGVRLAAPLVVVLLVAEVGLALVARAAPALNLMAVGGPLRLILGLLLLGVIAPAAVGLFSTAYSDALRLGLRIAETFR